MQTDIIIRADGGPQIGLGHLIRCMALADMLKRHFTITFYCTIIPEQIKLELQEKGYGVNVIESNSLWIQSVRPNQIVVIDHYGINADVHIQIRKQKAFVVCIDDLHDKYFEADLIINHAPGIHEKDYKALASTRFALGPDYALLREPFINAALNHVGTSNSNSLMICFGGADAFNLSCIALEGLSENKSISQIHVIVGSAYAFMDELRNHTKNDNRITIHHAISGDEMRAIMLGSAYAIAPASSIGYEVLACRLYWLGGFYVDNQMRIYEGFKDLGAFYDLGNMRIDLKSKLKELDFSKLPNQLNNGQIIDGKSGNRLLSLFFHLGDLFHLRLAYEGDMDLLYEWANEAEVRKNSIQSEPIPWENHQRWFRNKLADADAKLFILEWKRIPVAQIRFDLADDVYLIDYSVSSKFRGLGLGKLVVAHALSLMPSDREIHAFVKPENIISGRVFTSLGFDFRGKQMIKNQQLNKFVFAVPAAITN